MTCGVPQGSVLGIMIWNIAFDNILKEEVPPGVGIICHRWYPGGYGRGWYFRARAESEHCPWGYNLLDRVSQTEHSATTKMKAMSLVQSPFRLKREQIRLCTALKYLGLWFDGNLTFKEHAKRTATKPERVVLSISQAHVEPRGVSEGKRKLLASVAMHVHLYGVLIWADTINTREYQRMKMVSVQEKAAWKCVSADRNVSSEAVCVLAGISLTEIVADERYRVYSSTCRINSKSRKALQVRCEERQVKLGKWKERLSGS